MLAYTAKVVVKSLYEYCGTKLFELRLRDKQSRHYYFFVSKDGINISYGTEGNMIRSKVEDIEMLSLPNRLIPFFFEEKSLNSDGKGFFEQHTLNIKYEAQLFVKIFRIMKERLAFTVFHEGNYIDCFHIDGKLLYVEETDTDYYVVGTDLYKFHRTHENYEIININGLMSRYDFASFMEEQTTIARELGKTLHRVKDEFLLKAE